MLRPNQGRDEVEQPNHSEPLLEDEVQQESKASASESDGWGIVTRNKCKNERRHHQPPLMTNIQIQSQRSKWL